MQALDDLLSSGARLQPGITSNETTRGKEVHACVPDEGDNPRRVAQPGLEEAATHDLVRSHERGEAGFVDAEWQTFHVQVGR